MKKITFMLAMFAAISMNAQALFFDDFDDQDISDWTLIDADGDGNNFMIYNPSNANSPMLSSASFDNNSGPLFPDNYAISPAINAAGSSSLLLEYMVGGQDPSWYNETYTVYVSTGNTIADFQNTDPTVTVSFSENIGNDGAAAGALVARTLDATSLVGASTVYVALRHHDSTDEFIINFDNVALQGTLSVGDNAIEGFAHYVSGDILYMSANASLNKVNLYNVLGQQVISQTLNSNQSTVDLSRLNSGVYIVTVTAEGATKSFKIVKS